MYRDLARYLCYQTTNNNIYSLSISQTKPPEEIFKETENVIIVTIIIVTPLYECLTLVFDLVQYLEQNTQARHANNFMTLFKEGML